MSTLVSISAGNYLVPLNGLDAYIASNGTKTIMKRLTSILPLILSLLALAECYRADLPDSELVGTLWTLESIEVQGEQFIQPAADKQYDIQFHGDYHLEGQDDCNVYGGNYTLLENSKITLDSLVTTLVGCGPSDIGNHYYLALRAVDAYNIDGAVLRLYYDDDSVLLFQNQTP